MPSTGALTLTALATLLSGCPRGAKGEPPEPRALTSGAAGHATGPAAPGGSAGPAAPGESTGPAALGGSAGPAAPNGVSGASGAGEALAGQKGVKMVTGYYEFEPPAAWVVARPRPMTMSEPRYELPRKKPDDPVVALKVRFLHAHRDGDNSSDGSNGGVGANGDAIADVADGWQKRFGAPPARRSQPLELRAGGAAERVGEAPVAFVEHVAKGQAFLGAAVDLSSVNARTRSAYIRVRALTFELEGPAATVLAAKADFEALVRSVYLAK